MNKKTKAILDEMIELGIITKESDLTAGDNTSLLFDYMIRKYGHLLKDDVRITLPEDEYDKGELIHKIMISLGKYFLNNPQVIEKKNYKESDEPCIYIANHRFKDDILATMLAAKERSYLVFGSLPEFFGTFDGLMSAKNGVAMVNRKISSSRKSSVEKAKDILAHNKSVLIFPEGVWNKTPNNLLLDLWSGFYRIAKKEDGTFYKVVPIVNYIKNTHDKDKNNKIHTYVDCPINLEGMDEKEAITYIRDRMATIYYNMMEEYGKSTREEELKGFNSSEEAWEDELKKRVATASKYDIEIETSADRKDKNSPLSVWEPIANLEVTKENAIAVAHAKQLVKTLKKNDYQHNY